MLRKKESRSAASALGSIDGASRDPGAMSPAKRLCASSAESWWKTAWNLLEMRERKVEDSESVLESFSAISNYGVLGWVVIRVGVMMYFSKALEAELLCALLQARGGRCNGDCGDEG
jgi:hypothetical protein